MFSNRAEPPNLFSPLAHHVFTCASCFAAPVSCLTNRRKHPLHAFLSGALAAFPALSLELASSSSLARIHRQPTVSPLSPHAHTALPIFCLPYSFPPQTLSSRHRFPPLHTHHLHHADPPPGGCQRPVLPESTLSSSPSWTLLRSTCRSILGLDSSAATHCPPVLDAGGAIPHARFRPLLRRRRRSHRISRSSTGLRQTNSISHSASPHHPDCPCPDKASERQFSFLSTTEKV